MHALTAPLQGEFVMGCPLHGILEKEDGTKCHVYFDGKTSILDKSLAPVTMYSIKTTTCKCHGISFEALEGQHVIEEADGRKYDGQWRHGMWHGRGFLNNPVNFRCHHCHLLCELLVRSLAATRANSIWVHSMATGSWSSRMARFMKESLTMEDLLGEFIKKLSPSLAVFSFSSTGLLLLLLYSLSFSSFSSSFLPSLTRLPLLEARICARSPSSCRTVTEPLQRESGNEDFPHQIAAREGRREGVEGVSELGRRRRHAGEEQE
eukprot:753587-Hanusia_phi.AAC.3